jgi:CheY-like chemotaxis protein
MAPPAAFARVIVTDDDKDVALSLAALLQFELSPEVEIVITHDGTEALAEVARAPPLAVVIDLSMPGMTGLETALAIRQLCPSAARTALIAVSGDENLLDTARRSGCFRMVQRKPIDFDALLRLVKSL